MPRKTHTSRTCSSSGSRVCGPGSGHVSDMSYSERRRESRGVRAACDSLLWLQRLSMRVIASKLTCANCRHTWATELESLPPDVQEKFSDTLRDLQPVADC